MRLALLCPLLVLAACHSAPLAPPSPSLAIIQPAPPPVERRVERRAQRREAKIRDRELLSAAKSSLGRAIKRLDWLNGREPGT